MNRPVCQPRMTETERFAPEVRHGLEQLLQATDYAQDLDSSLWEFAVEIERLLALGMTTSDLRGGQAGLLEPRPGDYYPRRHGPSVRARGTKCGLCAEHLFCARGGGVGGAGSGSFSCRILRLSRCLSRCLSKCLSWSPAVWLARRPWRARRIFRDLLLPVRWRTELSAGRHMGWGLPPCPIGTEIRGHSGGRVPGKTLPRAVAEPGGGVGCVSGRGAGRGRSTIPFRPLPINCRSTGCATRSNA